MTAKDTYHEMKFDEAKARGRKIEELLEVIEVLDRRLAQYSLELRIARSGLRIAQGKKLKASPPQHPGQLSITEEAK